MSLTLLPSFLHCNRRYIQALFYRNAQQKTRALCWPSARWDACVFHLTLVKRQETQNPGTKMTVAFISSSSVLMSLTSHHDSCKIFQQDITYCLAVLLKNYSVLLLMQLFYNTLRSLSGKWKHWIYVKLMIHWGRWVLVCSEACHSIYVQLRGGQHSLHQVLQVGISMTASTTPQGLVYSFFMCPRDSQIFNVFFLLCPHAFVLPIC